MRDAHLILLGAGALGLLAGAILTHRRVRRALQSVYESGQELQAQFFRHVRRAVVFIVGASVVLVGVVMLVTPGPAVVLVPAGLGILATEFVWARRLLRRVGAALKDTGRKVAGRRGAGGAGNADDPADDAQA